MINELELIRQIEKAQQKVSSAEQILKSDLFMRPGEKIGVFVQPLNVNVAPHRHDYIEMNYIWRGSFEQVIEGKRLISKQGDLCILDTKAIHEIHTLEKDAVLINILMRKSFFDSMFLTRLGQQGVVSKFLVQAVLQDRSREHFLNFETRKKEAVHDALLQFLREYQAKDIGYEQIMESEMVILFTQLLRIVRNTPDVEKGVDQTVSVLNILRYIEQNVDNCTLEQTAKQFGIHPNYLTALLKRETGSSFLKHVQSQRLGKAKIYLQNSDLSVSEIAALCGYHNQHFFYQMFQEAEGCTPGVFRQKQNEIKNGQ